MKLAEFSIRRPITLAMLTVSAIVIGWISMMRLPLESMPSISSSSVNVRVNYPSSSPQEVEREITLLMEGSLATLNNIETISSTSSANNANLRIEFVSGTDMDIAATFSVDDGETWGADYDWYYWPDINDYPDSWDYSAAPSYSLEGVIGYSMAKGYSGQTDDVLFLSNNMI